MRRSIVTVFSLLVAVVAIALTPAAALGAVVRQGDSVTISQDISDDVYIFGSIIDVSGRIDGDVVAFGNVVTIQGDVTGDVIAAASSVKVNGDVTGSVRAAAGTVEVSGNVGQDVLAAGGDVRLSDSGRVGRDALLAGGTTRVRSDIGRDLMLGAGNAELASNVGGNVRADVESLVFRQGAHVAGDLTYSAQTASGVTPAAVDGQITRARPTRPEQTRPTAAERFFLAVVGWVRGYIGLGLFGLLFVLIVPVFAGDSSQYVFGRWLPSLGIGLAVMFVMPGVALLTFVIGLLVGGWWIAFMLLAVWWIALTLGAVVAAIAVGRAILARVTNPTAQLLLGLLLGLLVLRLLTVIPILGWLVGFVSVVMGTGALVLAIVDRRTAADAAGVGAAPPLMPESEERVEQQVPVVPPPTL